ncbi:hypothetical protein [Thermosulfurimonas sp. F29]|uniref:hypothetical protein n=1 Tax=Thermosulfurimonas sp. F29 TaxID=2867247 RepID=UPI001C83DB56|nr:hypothetical protein [Thermosulfurimonas sp. F29]MBX6424191.1 hypothetical protein [Thermosulfurimonas sp. F29]
MARGDEFLVDQLRFWNAEIYPVMVDGVLEEWVDYSLPRMVREFGSDEPFSVISNFSQATFSVLETPGGFTDPSRFYAGFFTKSSREDVEFFGEMLEAFLGMDEEEVMALLAADAIRALRQISGGVPSSGKERRAEDEVLIAAVRGLGLGVDVMAGEKRVYVLLRGEGGSGREDDRDWSAYVLCGWTFSWNGTLVERKVYRKEEKRFVRARGERGEREQVDVHLSGEEAWEKAVGLGLNAVTLGVVRRVLDSGLFRLDTISLSRERGTALYFD